MTTISSFLRTVQPYVLSILRIVIAVLFLQHGTQKLFGIPAPAYELPSPLPPMMLAAGLIEVIGGLAVLIGLLTRPVAFVLSGQMAFAYFIAHAPGGWNPVSNQGELAVLYCFMFLYLSVAGGGNIALDRILRRKRA